MTKLKLVITVIIIVSCIILFLVGRSLALNYVLKTAKSKLQNNYNLTLTYNYAGFKGLRSVLFTNMQINTTDSAIVFNADTLFCQLRIWPLFKGSVTFRNIILTGSNANITGTIFEKLLNSRKVIDTTQTLSITNYGLTAEKLINKFFIAIPQQIRLNSVYVQFISNKHTVKVNCEHFVLNKTEFKGIVNIFDNNYFEQWQTKGIIKRDEKKLVFTLFNSENGSITIPALKAKYETGLIFDTISGNFSVSGYNNNTLKLKGGVWACNMLLNNKRVSPQAIKIFNGRVNLAINIGERYFEIDSCSEVIINKLAFSPYLRYEKYNLPQLKVRIARKEFNADDLWQSLPEGLFSSVRDMKVSGKLTYSLNVDIDWNNLDSLVFDSHLERNNFKVINAGSANLSLMNQPFMHQVYERDEPFRTIWVGSESVDFVGINEVPDYLKYAILTSEDGGFFYHKGFNEEAWQKAIAENIRKKRFARGGSTISMQLVKNVYLNRNKTISRKLEEMLLVWMIENMRTVTKERMFEVYLNIIEWGPGVYGIKPAAQFYFKKKPSQLTLNESIFLASIIPSPKRFMTSFDNNGNLKPHLSFFYQKVSEIMLRRNQIQATDTINLKPNAAITGEAKKLLLKTDSLAADTVIDVWDL